MTEDLRSYPIYPYLDNIAATFAQAGLLLLAAETGAGKTTLLPWKLLSIDKFQSSKLLLLEPRRLAARAAAERISNLLGEKLGQRVGIRTRYETIVSQQTQLEVVTLGVLTRMLQSDPTLDGYGTLLFDEFHIRSLQGDLGLALAWESRKIFRPDLRIALLSATLPVEELARVFGAAFPLIEVPGRTYPVEVEYCPPLSVQEKIWEGAARLCQRALSALNQQAHATVLCFLPGFREMNRTRDLLCKNLPIALQNKIFLLHGQMLPEKQRQLLDPSQAMGARIILATNVAETSLTVPGVGAVVDPGWERRVRFSPRTGMDHWETLPISQASSEQRKGRAGRTGPGRCYRWWQPDTRREAFSSPEIKEADLAPLLLETSLWSATEPQALAWLTPPPEAALRQAAGLLQSLGMLDARAQITALGRNAANYALHPRLSKMLLSAKSEDVHTAALLAALLENEDLLPNDDPDLRDRLQAFTAWSQNNSPELHTGLAKRIWEDTRRLLKDIAPVSSSRELSIQVLSAGRLLFFAYPERLAKKTRQEDRGHSRWLLASGRGALLRGQLSTEDYLVAADLDGGEQDAKILLAAPIPRSEIENSLVCPLQDTWEWEWSGWKPKARKTLAIGAITVKEQKGQVPTQEALQAAAQTKLRAGGLFSLPWTEHAKQFLSRCRFVEKYGSNPDWPKFSDLVLLDKIQDWLLPFGQWDGSPIWNEQTLLSALENYLGWNRRKLLDELAPEQLSLPSGSHKKLDFAADEVPVIAARLQEFFGLRTTPKLCGQPLLLDLLSPASRTVQRTRDLDGFWDRAYPEVKKELMGRYPRHYWPDNPREAKATGRAKPRKK